MAKSTQTSIKHAIIDKTNSTILIAVGVAVFVVIFCGFAVRSLVSQSLFNQRVISAKKEALSTLRANKLAVVELEESYKTFEGDAINIIGGSPTGSGPKDGDNATLVLDSLPSEYDYPGLSSTIEKVLVDGGYQIESIGGSELELFVDDQGLDDSTITSAAESVPVEIPYPFIISSTPDSVQNLLRLLENSIRPLYVETLTIEGSGANLSANIGLKTFYQPATGLEVTTKEIK